MTVSAYQRAKTPRNILDELSGVKSELSSYQILSDKSTQQASDLAAELGELGIVIPTDDATSSVPNESGFSGVFLTPQPVDFSQGAMKLGAVENGALNFGVRDDGRVFLNAAEFNGLATDFRISLDGAGWLTRQTVTQNGETRIMRIGMEEGATTPEGKIQFYKPSATPVTIPNADFSDGMNDWTQTAAGKTITTTPAALGTLSGTVRAMAYDSTGNLYAGGNDMTTSNLQMWDGNTWTPIGTEAEIVYAVAIDVNDNVYFGGTFSGASGVRKWDGLSVADVGTLVGTVFALAIASNGDLYAGGSITGSDVKKWNGSAWSDVGTISITVYALAIAANGDLYAGGNSAIIQKWNGSAWSNVGTLVGTVFALAIDSNGDLYAGGSMTGVDVQKWNGSAWSDVGTISGIVYALGFAANGYLMAGHVIGLKYYNGSAWIDTPIATQVRALAMNGSNIVAGGAMGDTSAVYSLIEDVDWEASSGYAQIVSLGGTSPAFSSAARFAVDDGTSYNFSVRSYAAGTENVTLRYRVNFYDAVSGGSLIETVDIIERVGANLAWDYQDSIVTAPTGATHAELCMYATSAAGEFTARFDAVSVNPVDIDYQIIFSDAGISLPGSGTSAATLTNKSGASRSTGDVAVFDVTNASAFTSTTYLRDTRVCGVVGETIAADASGTVYTNAGSVVTVNCDTAAVAIGQFLMTSTTEGQATSAGYFRAAGVFALAMSSKTAGSTGTVSAMLVDNFRQAISGATGYVLGGYSGSTYINTGQKFNITTATWAGAAGAALSQARYTVGSLTYGTNGMYAIGGYTTGVVKTADYLDFATDTTAAQSSANLGTARRTLRGSASSSASGFICGGFVTSNVATTDKITFATGQRSAGSNLSSARAYQTTLSDAVYGYVRGGTADTADRITFATDTIAAQSSANLDASDSYYSAFSYPASAGYNAYKNGATAKCRKVDFATGTDAAVTSTPPAESALASAVGDGIAMHWLAGSNAAPYTQGCKFDAATETWSADAGASLSSAAFASAQSSYGAW